MVKKISEIEVRQIFKNNEFNDFFKNKVVDTDAELIVKEDNDYYFILIKLHSGNIVINYIENIENITEVNKNKNSIAYFNTKLNIVEKFYLKENNLLEIYTGLKYLSTKVESF